MSFLLGLHLLLQLGIRGDIAELRQFLGLTYPSVVERLDAKDHCA